jgi:hypothetical protein
MNYNAALDKYRRKPWIRPGEIVIAFEEPEVLGAIILSGTLRYHILREITKEEFLARLEANRRSPSFAAAELKMSGSRVDVSTAVDKAEPGPEYRYFYTAECI